MKASLEYVGENLACNLFPLVERMWLLQNVWNVNILLLIMAEQNFFHMGTTTVRVAGFKLLPLR